MVCSFHLKSRPEASKYLMRPVPHLMQTAHDATLSSSSCGLFDQNARELPGQKLRRLWQCSTEAGTLEITAGSRKVSPDEERTAGPSSSVRIRAVALNAAE